MLSRGRRATKNAPLRGASHRVRYIVGRRRGHLPSFGKIHPSSGDPGGAGCCIPSLAGSGTAIMVSAFFCPPRLPPAVRHGTPTGVTSA